MALNNEILGKRYKIIREIGAGGMGTVYQSLDLETKENVAVKILNYRGPLKENEIRFKREFRSMARCDHPNVVSVYDFGTQGKTLFFVMQYIIGADLRQILIEPLKLGGLEAFDMGKFLDIFIQVCDALDFIHSQKIIHRDIKPENIMIDKKGRATVMDFGLSRIMDTSGHITHAGDVMGTAAYISPEQGRGLPVDYRTDIYSLGVCMYEAATGRLPFQASNPIALVFQHVQDIPQNPSVFNPYIPPNLEQTILKTMKKDPSDRYQRAGDIIRDLQVTVQQNIEVEDEVIGTYIIDTLNSINQRPDFFLEPPFIGRKTELSLIHEMIIDVKNFRGSTLLLEGEAGIGKTRLIEESLEFARRFRRNNHLSSLLITCNEEGTMPYGPIIEAIRAILSKSVISSTPVKLSTFDSAKLKILARLIPEMHHLFPQLRTTEEEATYETEPDPRKFKQDLIEGIIYFFKMVTSIVPLYVCFENVQWADDSTMELLSKLMNSTSTMPLLLGLSYRPIEFRQLDTLKDSHEKGAGTFSARRIELPPLDRDEIVALVSAMLGDSFTAYEGFFDELRNISNGNPYFVLEILKSALAEDTIFREKGHWIINKDTLDESRFPSSIREIIIRRLITLTPEVQQLLEFMALIEHGIDLPLLTHLMHLEEGKIFEMLDHLVKEDLIVAEDILGIEQYRFKQSITRTILLDRIPIKKKKVMHESIAEYLVQRLSATSDEKLEQIAYHYNRSSNKSKSLKYSVAAAEKAVSVSAKSAALHYYDLALKILREEGETFKDYTEQKIMRLIAAINIELGRLDVAYQFINDALVLSENLVDHMEIVRLLELKGTAYFAENDFVRALEMWEKASLVATRLDKQKILASITDKIGQVCIKLAQYEEAGSYITKALELYQACGDAKGEAMTLKHMGKLFEITGHTSRALETYEKALEIVERLNERNNKATLLESIASVLATQGMYGRSLNVYDQASKLMNSAMDTYGKIRVNIRTAQALFYAGNYGESYNKVKACLEDSEKLGDEELQIFAHASMAFLLLHIGLLSEAHSNLSDAMRRMKASGLRSFELWLKFLDGLYQLKSQNYDQALAIAEDAYRTAKFIGDKQNVLNATLLQLRVNYQLFRNDAASQFAGELIALSHEIKSAYGYATGLVYQGNLLFRESDLNIPELKSIMTQISKVLPTLEIPDLRWRFMQLKGKSSLVEGNIKEAIQNVEQALNVMEGLYEKVEPISLRKPFFESNERITLQAFLIALHVHEGNEEKAFKILMNAASSTLKKLLLFKNKWRKDILDGILEYSGRNSIL